MDRNSLNLLPCAGCRKDKVLKEGDYCMQCALDPALIEHQYIVLSPAMVVFAAELSGLPSEYLRTKMERTFEAFQHYVIFKAHGGWQDIVIDEKFHIPTVMKALFKRLED